MSGLVSARLDSETVNDVPVGLRMAYIIIAHKNFDQVLRLINRLADATAHFVVIIDRKVPSSKVMAFKAMVSGRPSVQIIDRLSIYWGRFSLTNANIVGLEELFTGSIPFDYVFSMSGQDYPLVTTKEMQRVLKEAGGYSFLEHQPFPIKTWIDGGEGRIYSWNLFLPKRRVIQLPKATMARNRLVRLIYSALNQIVPRRGPLPGGMKAFGGSMHWILSREAAEYVQGFLTSHPEFIRRFRFTLVSDEIFFQTILANSKLRDKLINSDQRYLRWSSEDAPSPDVLTMKDLPEIKGSGMLFARKFDTGIDAEVLDAIDALSADQGGALSGSHNPND